MTCMAATLASVMNQREPLLSPTCGSSEICPMALVVAARSLGSRCGVTFPGMSGQAMKFSV